MHLYYYTCAILPHHKHRHTISQKHTRHDRPNPYYMQRTMCWREYFTMRRCRGAAAIVRVRWFLRQYCRCVCVRVGSF